MSFAFLKATEGGDGIDPAFATNWQAAAQAGSPRVRGAVDLNAFAGSVDAWRAWLAARSPP